MAEVYVICEPCYGTMDRACVEICPVQDSAMWEGHRDGFPDQIYIDPELCIGCSLCEPECPVDAIYVESDVPEQWTRYIQLNATFPKV